MCCNRLMGELVGIDCQESPKYIDWEKVLKEAGFDEEKIEEIGSSLVEKYGKPLVITAFKSAGKGFCFEPKTGNLIEGDGHQFCLEVTRLGKKRKHYYSYVF